MSSENLFVIMGNLTRDPELRQTQSGTSVCTLGVAVNSSYKNAQGEYVEKADFFNVTVWGKNGENCANYLQKGRPVYIRGRLEYNTWEDDQGNKRSEVQLTAQRVQFLGSKQSQGQNQGQGSYQNNQNYNQAPAQTQAPEDEVQFPSSEEAKENTQTQDNFYNNF